MDDYILKAVNIIKQLNDIQKVEFAVRHSLNTCGDIGFLQVQNWLESNNRSKDSLEEVVQAAAWNAFKASGLGIWHIPKTDWIYYYTILTVDYMRHVDNQLDFLTTINKMELEVIYE